MTDLLGYLRCPHCGEALARSGESVRCAQGHSFDIARQGYLNLLPGDAHAGTADTPEMVAAREAFLAAGHFERLGERVADEAQGLLAGDPGACVVELGAGTGWYLASVMSRLPAATGLALDLSKPALRRAARAHPRIAAVGCDAWGALPVRDRVAALALSVFAPRGASELARVLRPEGVLVVVTPRTDHLAELVEALELLHVDARKEDRLAEQLDPHFALERRSDLTWSLRLGHADSLNAALMGPSAAHLDRRDLHRRVRALPEAFAVTAAVTIGVYRRRG
jgi:23S rRNA (guanine745-N1)-methyltransferase